MCLGPSRYLCCSFQALPFQKKKHLTFQNEKKIDSVGEFFKKTHTPPYLKKKLFTIIIQTPLTKRYPPQTPNQKISPQTPHPKDISPHPFLKGSPTVFFPQTHGVLFPPLTTNFRLRQGAPPSCWKRCNQLVELLMAATRVSLVSVWLLVAFFGGFKWKFWRGWNVTKNFRYLKCRVSWTLFLALLGVGFPLHKPYIQLI